MFQPSYSPPPRPAGPGQLRINPLDLHRLTTQPEVIIPPTVEPPVVEKPLESQEHWTMIVGELPSSGFVARSQTKQVKEADGSIKTTCIDVDFLCGSCRGKHDYEDIHGKCPGCGNTICRKCARELLDERMGCRACVQKFEAKDGQKGFVYSNKEPKYLPVIQEEPEPKPDFTLMREQALVVAIIAFVVLLGMALLNAPF